MARKYSEKASEKIGRTMHEFKRGKLKSSSGQKVTSREQAIAIGLSQARRAGYKLPPEPSHATMGLDARVRARLSQMRPGSEIDAAGMARELRADPLGTNYALLRAVKDGYAVTEDERWFGPADGSGIHHARKKSPAQLDREIAEALGGSRRSHSTKKTWDSTFFAVEIDPAEFDRDRDLPADARWREDRAHLAEKELAGGRSYRRPKNARYTAIEWEGYRGAVGRLLDWLEATPGITRYAEIFA